MGEQGDQNLKSKYQVDTVEYAGLHTPSSASLFALRCAISDRNGANPSCTEDVIDILPDERDSWRFLSN